MSTVANRNQVYQQAPALIENMLEKIGEVTGLATANSKRLITTRTTDEITSAVELLTSKKLSNKIKLSDSVLPTIDAQNGVWYAGKLLTTTLKAKSKTIGEAAEWYRSEIDKLDGMIDKELTVKAQIEQAEKLAQILMDSAAASLYDKSLAATLREAFVRPSVEKLTNELTGYGSVLQAKILKELTAPIDTARKWFEPGACFAAGTLVHTKEGLVPIEQIKVGDYVISKPENGGEQAYKRVLKTFAHEPQSVMSVMYALPDNLYKYYPLTVTFNHPFWVDGDGWTAAQHIPQTVSFTRAVRFELVDGSPAYSDGPNHIYVSDQDGVGWHPEDQGMAGAFGGLWDHVNHKLIANNVRAIDGVRYEELEDPYLKLPVYNLEVEDFHTYYVGQHGVWVHNTNCGGITFVQTELDVSHNALLREFLGADDGHSFLELRNVVEPTIFPQNIPPEGNLINVPALTLAQINALLPQARQYWLDAGASAAVLNRATFAIADLPFGMAGQTANNLITFDTLGAGWGWYVDATPADPSGFQATAQATVFAADSSSEAANKLDLLTVLIHELGHVAGLLHAAAENDVMSQYLVPGERRLPDAADMAVLQTQGAPFYVGNITSTWVTLPTAAVFANALHTQMQTAFTTNPILTNGSLNSADGWSTQGGVDIANGAAVMREVSNNQTRLSQVFRLKPTDRFLSFTLSGAALDGALPLPQTSERRAGRSPTL